MNRHVLPRALCACLLVLCLLPGWARALAGQAVRIEPAQAGDAIRYPQLAGMENAFVQDSINASVAKLGDIALHEGTNKGQGTGVAVTFEAWLLTADGVPAVFSAVLAAEGKMPNGRIGHRYTPMMFDLRSGQQLSAAEIFTSREEAQAFFDGMVEEISRRDEYSYVDMSAAVPVPLDRTVLTDGGLRILYPAGGFQMLSGRSGAFDFALTEAEGVLNISDGSLLARLDVWRSSRLDGAKERLEAALAARKLPGLPGVLGGDIGRLAAAHKELTDPEAFLTGEQYFLEAPAFRGVSLIVKEGEKAVSGVLMRRGNLLGLAIGGADKASCRAALGEECSELPLDAAAAQQYGMEPGSALVRDYGAVRLMAAFDERDTLAALYISVQ